MGEGAWMLGWWGERTCCMSLSTVSGPITLSGPTRHQRGRREGQAGASLTWQKRTKKSRWLPQQKQVWRSTRGALFLSLLSVSISALSAPDTRNCSLVTGRYHATSPHGFCAISTTCSSEGNRR